MTSDSSDQNKRAFTRSSVHPLVKLLDDQGGELLKGHAVDVSLGGLSVEGSAALSIDQQVEVLVYLGDETLEPLIHAMARVVRTDDKTVAVEMNELEDMESLTHLRNLVLYNSTDTDAVEQEFREHPGISRKPSRN